MSQQITTIVHPISSLPELPKPPSLLPFRIDYTGPAPVSTYLLTRPAPASSSSSNDLLLSSFRGRQIVGQPLVLPPGYQGYIFQVPPPPSAVASLIDAVSKNPAQQGTTFGQASLRLDQSQSSGQPRPFARTRSATKRFFSEQDIPPSSTEAPSFRVNQPGAKKQKVAAKKFKLESDSEVDEGEEEGKVEENISVPTALPIETTSSTLTVSTVVTESDSDANIQEEPNPSTTASSAVVLSSADTPSLTTTTRGTAADSTVPSLSDGQSLSSTITYQTHHTSTSSNTPILLNVAPSEPSPSLHSERVAEGTGETYDINLDVEEDAELYIPPGPPPRELVPTHTFTQITIWTADDPVDRARDELFRCFDVGGWIDLAEAIHSED